MFEKGQKLRHIPSGKIVEVVRDEGGVKVLVRIDGVELSVPRRNLAPVSPHVSGHADGEREKYSPTPSPHGGKEV